MMMSGSARIIARRPLAKVSLRDAVDLALDRVLDRDDVLLRRVDLPERCVQRGRLARPGRTGDEHGAVGLAEGPLEAVALAVGHAQLAQLGHALGGVEDAHDDRLAVDAGERDDAQVDVVAVDRHADAAVLRDAALGDVEVAHDLHAADDAADHAPRDGGGVLQHAVDAEAHAQLVAVGREVHVGGALLDRLRDDAVDELDDRRVLGGLEQVDDLGALFLLLLVRRRLDHVVQPRQARDQRADVLARGDGGAHLVAGHQRDVVDGEHVGRVGHRDEQRPVADELHRHGVVALGRRRGDQVGRPHVDVEDGEVEVVQPVALRDRAGEPVLRERARLQQDLLGQRAPGAGGLDGLLDAVARGEPELDDDVGQEARPAVAGARR
jgi:hypothetical protein